MVSQARDGCEAERSTAAEVLQHACDAVTEARDALDRCRSAQPGCGRSPDCSSQAAALEAALQRQAKCERWLAVATGALDRMNAFTEVTRDRGRGWCVRADHAREDMTKAVAAAEQAISGYLAVQSAQDANSRSVNHPSGKLHSWMSPTFAPGALNDPKWIRDRLNVGHALLKEFTTHLAEADARFQKESDGLCQKLANAAGPAERDIIFMQTRQRLSGLWAEKFVEAAFAPLAGTIQTQRSCGTADGGVTFTDIVLSDLKSPIVLGRGERLGVAEGGSLAIEVKSGTPDYIYRELTHMVRQASGHRHEDASCTLVTRDIKRLSTEREAELRKALREAGSPIIGMLPTKAEIDRLCWDLVRKEWPE